LSPKLKEALEIYQINSPVNEHELVFCNKDRNPLDPDNLVKRDFQSALRMAGLRKIRFHDLRHTAAALMIAVNESPELVKRQLGHSSIEVTFDVYGHLFPSSMDNLVGGLDRLYEESRAG